MPQLILLLAIVLFFSLFFMLEKNEALWGFTHRHPVIVAISLLIPSVFLAAVFGPIGLVITLVLLLIGVPIALVISLSR